MRRAGIAVAGAVLALAGCGQPSVIITPPPRVPEKGWSVVPGTGETLFPGASGRVVNREEKPPGPYGGTPAWELTTADGEEGFSTFRVMEHVYDVCAEGTFYPDCMLPSTTPNQ
jgi:hypothetical protein